MSKTHLLSPPPSGRMVLRVLFLGVAKITAQEFGNMSRSHDRHVFGYLLLQARRTCHFGDGGETTNDSHDIEAGSLHVIGR